MLNKKALRKDMLTEIKHSLSRFLSIFAIVALGSGFFAGLKSTCPDMKETAHNYFVETNLMDLKLLSTYGISPDDVSAVNGISGVTGVMPSYSMDFFLKENDTNYIIKAISYNKKLKEDDVYNINKPVVLEGRMPQKSGECVVEKKLNAPACFKIGEKVTLSSPDESKGINSFLKTDSFEVVGVVSNPTYLGMKRGATNVGNGSVSNFIMISEEDFSLPYYTELYTTISGLSELSPFSDEYKNKIEEYIPKVKQALNDSVNVRYEQAINDANSKIQKAKNDLENAQYLAKADMNTLQVDIKKGEAELTKLNIQYQQAVNDKSPSQTLIQAAIVQTQNKISLEKDKINKIQTNTLPSDAEIAAQIQGYKDGISKAEAQVSSVKAPETYVLDRLSSEDYFGFSSDSEKVDALAQIFPLFFIIVSALVCLTTMTRMVEEQRTQIGTYKALGYGTFSIAWKFLFYGLAATILGAVTGLAIGFKILPSLIYSSYKMMYNIPNLITPFRWDYAAGTIIVAVLCTTITVIAACIKELRANPAQIMRPKSPAQGKRVFLERLPFIWNKLSFLAKVTIRNLVRYKKRFFMTIIGIAGCTALLLSGFGINHSVSSIVDIQFEKIFVYDGIAALNNNAVLDDAKSAMKNEYVSDSMPCFQKTIKVNANGITKEANILTPEQPEKIGTYISLHKRDNGVKISLGDDGVVINEKLANLLDIKIGDKISLDNGDGAFKEVKVSAITENYTLHYVYVSPNLYNSIYGSQPKYNAIAFQMNNDTKENEDALASQLLNNNNFLGVSYSSESGSSFNNMAKNINNIVLFLIICAGALAFIVLYNLSNINVTERARELATIKLLGFYDNEVSAYIYRENTVSSIIGMLIGFIFGVFLHRFVIITAEVDQVMFVRELNWQSFLYAGLLTMAFTFIVNLILHFKLKSINMVESLKSVE